MSDFVTELNMFVIAFIEQLFSLLLSFLGGLFGGIR
jgi:hypothetical protein